MRIYGFVLLASNPEGHLRFIPEGCTDVLVYSDDALTFHEEPVGENASHVNDFAPGEIFELLGAAFNKVSAMGKYKLDIAVRIRFPRYSKAAFSQKSETV
jgi:hypothetical protein